MSYTGRFIKSITDENTLKIVDTQFDDAGLYVCRASTELDFDDASAILIVKDRPNRPKITKVNCNGTIDQPFAIVQWEGTGLNFCFFLKQLFNIILIIQVLNDDRLSNFDKLVYTSIKVSCIRSCVSS